MNKNMNIHAIMKRLNWIGYGVTFLKGDKSH